MPIQLCKLIKSVEEIQDKKDNAEQLDAAADEAMPQIAEQNDSRLVARDVGSCRYDQCRDDHLFDVKIHQPQIWPLHRERSWTEGIWMSVSVVPPAALAVNFQELRLDAKISTGLGHVDNSQPNSQRARAFWFYMSHCRE